MATKRSLKLKLLTLKNMLRPEKGEITTLLSLGVGGGGGEDVREGDEHFFFRRRRKWRYCI